MCFFNTKFSPHTIPRTTHPLSKTLGELRTSHRLGAELERRNADEQVLEMECQVCFEECDEDERCILHGDMHWLCKGCLRELTTHAKANGELRCVCPHCRAEATLQALEMLL